MMIDLTGVTEEDDDGEDDDSEPIPEEVAFELHEAFVAQENAKARYKDLVKSRGFDMEGNKGQDRAAADRLKLAKSRSFCAGCKRRGHWHRDPECPLNGGKKELGDYGLFV